MGVNCLSRILCETPEKALFNPSAGPRGLEEQSSQMLAGWRQDSSNVAPTRPLQENCPKV